MKRQVNRRAVMVAGVALVAAPFIRARALASPPLVRYDAASPEGAAMLAKFAEAVKRMSARDAGDPASWTFQWNVHHVRGDKKKDDEVANLPPENRALAAELWDTCQAHGSNGIENCFLPWHRMYLYYFERIVRGVLSDGSFTMPYWDYTNPNSRALPAQFRDTNSPLYRAHRKDAVNAGQAIDEGQGTPSPLDPVCLEQTEYLSAGGAKQGFCLNIDSGLHASVHVLVGDRFGMGDIAWAANDPIFWLHHSNVDRLWASWNANGNDNPDDAAWRNQQFVFADERGARAVARVRDFSDIAALGYSYDQLAQAPLEISQAPQATGAGAEAPPPSAPPPPVPHRFKAAPAPVTAVASAAAPVSIGTAPVQVALNRPQLEAAPGAAAPPTVGAHRAAKPLAAAAPLPSHLYLVIRNLQARAQPGVLYAVYLNVGSGSNGRTAKLGTINFFDAGMAGMVSQKFASFDVTGILDGNVSLKDISVTIAAVGQPASDAKPVIGDITLTSA